MKDCADGQSWSIKCCRIPGDKRVVCENKGISKVVLQLAAAIVLCSGIREVHEGYQIYSLHRISPQYSVMLRTPRTHALSPWSLLQPMDIVDRPPLRMSQPPPTTPTHTPIFYSDIWFKRLLLYIVYISL